MHASLLFLFIFSFLWNTQLLQGQKISGKSYHIDGHQPVYFPLGRISFADSLVAYHVGNPAPIQKYRDSIQVLHEPDYVGYRTPNFVSLGCEGVLVVKFIDNGFMNLEGDDLYIFEVGPSRESAKIEISEDGENWIYAGTIAGGKSAIDLSDEGIDRITVFYYLRVTDLKDLCEHSISAGADIDAIGAINSVIKLSINSDVLFDVGKYDLKEAAMATIDSLVGKIQIIEEATLVIEGHTDSDGSHDMNMTLSENRSNAVKQRLQELFGEDAQYDYEVKWYGKTKPRVPNDSDENKQLNRRVEITVQPPQAYYQHLKVD